MLERHSLPLRLQARMTCLESLQGAYMYESAMKRTAFRSSRAMMCSVHAMMSRTLTGVRYGTMMMMQRETGRKEMEDEGENERRRAATVNARRRQGTTLGLFSV